MRTRMFAECCTVLFAALIGTLWLAPEGRSQAESRNLLPTAEPRPFYVDSPSFSNAREWHTAARQT